MSSLAITLVFLIISTNFTRKGNDTQIAITSNLRYIVAMGIDRLTRRSLFVLAGVVVACRNNPSIPEPRSNQFAVDPKNVRVEKIGVMEIVRVEFGNGTSEVQFPKGQGNPETAKMTLKLNALPARVVQQGGGELAHRNSSTNLNADIIVRYQLPSLLDYKFTLQDLRSKETKNFPIFGKNIANLTGAHTLILGWENWNINHIEIDGVLQQPAPAK